jgi:hypothetical protein
MMARRLVLTLALTTSPAFAGAQSTQQYIDRAVAMYEALQVEAARPLLLNIISPNYLQTVTPEQKVTALKYLGASYALLDNQDSATAFFVAALDFDPFTDLDASKFSAAELVPFNMAKRRIFKLGIRPIAPLVIDPKAETGFYTFQLVTTHRALLTVELIHQGDPSRVETLFQGESDGVRDIRWNGVMSNGQLADSSVYLLRATASSRLAGTSSASMATVERQFFKVEHSFAPLEDALPELVSGVHLLPEQYPARGPWFDLVKGGSMAMAAVALPLIAFNGDVRWGVHAAAASALGVGAAIASFSYRHKKREIPENVQENERRKQQRLLFNAGVKARNDARLEARKLIITPAAGVGR